jgi:hypothetical protein
MSPDSIETKGTPRDEDVAEDEDEAEGDTVEDEEQADEAAEGAEVEETTANASAEEIEVMSRTDTTLPRNMPSSTQNRKPSSEVFALLEMAVPLQIPGKQPRYLPRYSLA